jgi:hypothetical protein
MLIAFSASSIAVKYKKRQFTAAQQLEMGNLLFVAATLLSSISRKLSA